MYHIGHGVWKKIEFDFTIPKQVGIDCCVVDYRKLVERKEKDFKDMSNK